MNDKPDKEQTPELEEEQSGGGGILLWLLLGILLVMLLGGGLAIASFLGLFSVDGIVGKARQIPERIGQIRQMPIVAKYYPAVFPEAQTDTNETETVSAPVTFPHQIAAEPIKNLPKPADKPVAPPPTPEALAKAKAEEDKKIARLARLYANMKPEEAAPIMKELDDDLVVSILKKMEDDQAARVLTVLEPQRAAKLTRLLAGKQKVIIAVE